jgi:hypothetical protein
MKIDLGRIVKQKNGLGYVGSMKFKEGDEVYLVKKEDYEESLKDVMRIMLKRGMNMADEFIQYFPDTVIFDNLPHPHYLDRRIYTANLEKEFWIRYSTIEKFIDEGDLNENPKT